MDKIHVSDVALRNSAVALQQLADQSANITTTCMQQLSSQLSALDVNFRKDVERYIDDVQNLNKKINACVYENLSAISDRVAKLTEYETHNYSKRNIGL